jgi:putative hydrolase of the HAD superfamily
MIQAICLDMDDTLIVNQVLYSHAQAMLEGYMTHYGVRPEETTAVFNAIDKELFKTHGIARTRMPQGFEDTLRHFIPAADAETIATVRGFAERIFTTVADVKPDIAPALNKLARIAPLYIVTGGDQGVQQFRIDHLPFKAAFNGFTIVPKKDADVYRQVAQQLNIDPRHLVMVGDSLRSDVLPAVEAGWRGVWIEAHNSHHEIKEAKLPAGAFKFSSLLELARHIEATGDLKPAAANGNAATARRAFAPKR